MKKWLNILTIISLVIFSLVQIYDLRTADLYDFFETTFYEEYLEKVKKQGLTTQESCEFLLKLSKSIKAHEEIHGNYTYNILDIFNQIERECRNTIESYQKTQRVKTSTI